MLVLTDTSDSGDFSLNPRNASGWGHYGAFDLKKIFESITKRPMDTAALTAAFQGHPPVPLVQQLPDPASPVYGCDAFWNTFWNLNQLWNLMTPDVSDKWVRSLLEIRARGGWLHVGLAFRGPRLLGGRRPVFQAG